MAEPRERYIPAGFVRLPAPTVGGLEVYGTPDDVTPVRGICYRGKKMKREWYYNFRSLAEREVAIAETAKRIQAHDDLMWARRAERMDFVHQLKVGDILTYSWGYEETHQRAFQVVALRSAKTVQLRALTFRTVRDHGPQAMSDSRVPVPDSFEDEATISARVVPFNGGPGGAVIGRHLATIWRGEALHESWYG